MFVNSCCVLFPLVKEKLKVKVKDFVNVVLNLYLDLFLDLTLNFTCRNYKNKIVHKHISNQTSVWMKADINQYSSTNDHPNSLITVKTSTRHFEHASLSFNN